MPNWKYPCIKCSKPVKVNQQGLECNSCIKWIHLKCTRLTETQYIYLEENSSTPFICFACNPDWVCNPSSDLTTLTTEIETNLNSSINSSSPSLNDSTSFSDVSSANSSDFVYVDESDSDSESRGLNFESLPVRLNTKKQTATLQLSFAHTINYKYPCLVCFGPCKEKVQDSICCTLCDEWVHRECSNITIDQFKIYCSPDHAGDPFIVTIATDIELADIKGTMSKFCF